MQREPEQIYYDGAARRLVFLSNSATVEYWDKVWTTHRNPGLHRHVSKRNFVVRYTRKYLRPPAVVLEGGCGLAHQSWTLNKLGYRPIALDFATTTVQYLKEHVPEVNPIEGDVRRLPLGDSSVDGYWSLGVIEHFYDGYQAIRDEMTRVIRPGGYLFLTFPHMSRLRRLRAALDRYPTWGLTPDRLERFYQFALDETGVARDFTRHGFRLRETTAVQGLTGLKRDLPATAAAVSRLESSTSAPQRLLAALAERAARPFSSHIALLVLERTSGH